MCGKLFCLLFKRRVMARASVRRRASLAPARRKVGFMPKGKSRMSVRKAGVQGRSVRRKIVKRKSVVGKVYMDDSGLASYSLFKASHSLAPALRTETKLTASNYELVQATQFFSCTDGIQNFTSFGTWQAGAIGGASDLDLIRSNIISSGTYKTAQWLAQSSIGHLKLTNLSNTLTKVTLLDIACRRDSSISPESAWSSGMVDQGALSANVIGTYPQMSSLFNQFFKIVRRSTFLLGPGFVHDHKVTLCPNKKVHNELLAGGSTNLAGFTFFTMLIAEGMPRAGVAHANVSTSAVQLAVLFTKTLKYTWLSDSTNSVYGTNTLNTANGVLTNPLTGATSIAETYT